MRYQTRLTLVRFQAGMEAPLELWFAYDAELKRIGAFILRHVERNFDFLVIEVP